MHKHNKPPLTNMAALIWNICARPRTTDREPQSKDSFYWPLTNLLDHFHRFASSWTPFFCHGHIVLNIDTFVWPQTQLIDLGCTCLITDTFSSCRGLWPLDNASIFNLGKVMSDIYREKQCLVCMFVYSILVYPCWHHLNINKPVMVN